MELVFSLANAYVMPFWLLMILAPRWEWTRRVMESGWALVPLAGIYLAVVVPGLGPALPELMNPRLEPIRALLSAPEGTTGAWIHLLCFDLFAGRWIYLDARARGFAWRWVAPALVLTLMIGPGGWLSYWVGSRLAGRRAAA